MNKDKRTQTRQRYETKRTIKNVSFNNETEADLLAIANQIDFSQWVKEKLRQEFGK